MPRKTFANGFPLPASDLNTYLMDQSVQTYADATARTAALATPVEGQMSYLADTNTAYVYDGTSWNAVVDAKNYGATLPNGAAGRNKIINGAFDFWQRGTSIATGTNRVYTADRWNAWRGALVAGMTVYQVTGFTGYKYGARIQRDSGNTSTQQVRFAQDMESLTSIPLAGLPVTLSFYARAGANYSASGSSLGVQVVSGTGTDQNIVSGYTGATSFITSSATLTTTLQRFTYTGIVPSTATQVGLVFNFDPLGTAGANDFYDIVGVQLEVGSVATPFSRAGGTLQGELAACQRYYVRFPQASAFSNIGGYGNAISTTAAPIFFAAPVEMRVTPTSIESANVSAYDGVNIVASTSISLGGSTAKTLSCYLSAASGLVQYRPYLALANAANAYVGFSAEL